MNAIRSANLYVSSQVHRWLKWMAEIESKTDAEAANRTTPDAIAERILREHILAKYPTMGDMEAKYWSARGKLDEEIIAELKQQTK